MKLPATLCVAMLMACQHDAGTHGAPESGAEPQARPPLTQSSPTADCASAVSRVRSAIEQQVAYVSGPSADPKLKLWFGRTMAVMQAACEQDHWPADLVACMSASLDLSSLTTHCNQQMSPELQGKFQARMTKAMEDMKPELTETRRS